ncbi:Flp pilus assembly protein, protease CpaA [Pseudobutyrivibrio sp. NOR37]|uniref:Prepilin peptidase n=1 Tax=Pseudobutyrivibrio xylanivorans TaxID=185007 RepID=A0A6M0LH76_PSEXY|nr:prepilin peptidase [Pseudobutyrivibrio xylanivorans]SFR72773.1 Flp pilus assembly protein, protease CpaA [Pseudobutyrivibrio sp. NOR37]
MLCIFSQVEFIILPEMEVRKISTFLIWSILTTGCLFDARDYKIPNELIILGYIGGLLLNIHSYQIMGVAIFITKAIWPILLLSLLTVVRGLGAGDVKLFSVMSTMVGAADLVTTFIYSVMIAGVIAIGLCIKNGHIVKRKLHYSYYIAAAFFLLQYKQG